MARIIVTIPEPRAEYDVSNQRQILEALDTLKNQLNFSFQTDFKNEQDTINWFISLQYSTKMQVLIYLIQVKLQF